MATSARKALRPKEVVLAALSAANQGDFARANNFVAPSVSREVVDTHAAMLAVVKSLKRTLRKLKGKRGEAYARTRKMLQAMLRSYEPLAKFFRTSSRVLADLWRAATRNSSIAEIRAAREVIRGSRARVYLRITYRDGTVKKDSEPLVLYRGRWLLG